MATVSGQMNKPATPAAATVSAAQTQAPSQQDPTKTANAVRAVGAPFQIQTMQQRETWLKILIYGRHGSGKTELAGSSADVETMRDVLLVDAEKGNLTLFDSPRISSSHLIDRIPVTTFKQVAQIQEFLKAHCKHRDESNEEALKKLQAAVTGIPVEQIDRVRRYRTVILDSLTEIETYCTYTLLNLDSQKVEADPIDVAGWPEYRKNFEMVKLLVRAYRDLPMNVIFLCPEQWSQDEQKKYHYTPQLTGKLSDQVQGFVDIVGWLTTGSATDEKAAPRRMFVQPIAGPGIPKFDAKNRRPVYREAWFDEPSMSSIMKGVGLLK